MTCLTRGGVSSLKRGTIISFILLQILSQAESRAHRIGQSQPVLVKYLLAPGTADDAIWPKLKEKQKILKEFGVCQDSFENASAIRQTMDKLEGLKDNLNNSRTEANTLDITTYFKDTSKDESIHREVSFDSNADLFDGVDISEFLDNDML